LGAVRVSPLAIPAHHYDLTAQREVITGIRVRLGALRESTPPLAVTHDPWFLPGGIHPRLPSMYATMSIQMACSSGLSACHTGAPSPIRRVIFCASSRMPTAPTPGASRVRQRWPRRGPGHPPFLRPGEYSLRYPPRHLEAVLVGPVDLVLDVPVSSVVGTVLLGEGHDLGRRRLAEPDVFDEG